MSPAPLPASRMRAPDMETREAVALIAGALPKRAGMWADIGAGRGTFTAAMAELLEPPSRIYAVDRDARSMGALARLRARDGIEVIPVTADFTLPFDLPGLGKGALDGMLLANALHFVRDAEGVLARLTEWLRPGGRVVVVEYDDRPAGRWVPYPISAARLPALAAAAGLSAPRITAKRRSDFGGILYVAVADRTV